MPERVVRPLLRARAALREEYATLHSELLEAVREDEVCRRLKEDVATRNVTVIMVSGFHHHANVRRARDVGAKAYIWKPFNEDELLSVVYVALDERAAPLTKKGEGA